MSFFTAVIAAEGRDWRVRDVDVEGCDDLDELVVRLRDVALDGGPVLCLIELEDGWFAIVRADEDADETSTVFVSNMNAARLGHYGPILAAAEDIDTDLPAGVHAYEREADDEDEDEDLDSEREHDLAAEVELQEAVGGHLVQPDPDGEPVDEWAGNPALLQDYGISAQDLVGLVEDNPDDPATVLGAIGDRAGFADLLENLR